MMEMNSKTVCQTTETLPTYVNPDQIFDTNNMRLRHIKSNSPTQTSSQPAHLILSTSDFQLNERDNDLHLMVHHKHNKTQMMFLILTALSYLFHILRTYIPENIQTSSQFWSRIKPSPIPRVYTSDFRPNLQIENLLLRSAEIFQTLWIIYILSFIARRTHLGYLYRNPNIFNLLVCSLLTTAVSLQAISQTLLPPEILCACLFISLILLIITCRLIALRLLKYEEKLKSIDFLILRYFVLNSLFLYTISIFYLTICSSIECVVFHLDPNNQSLSFVKTIGFSIILILLLIYFMLDQFVYKNEFQSIWTPYLFLAIRFHCPSLSNENDWNFYFLWILFSTIIFLILIRIGRQIYLKYHQRKIRQRIRSFLEQNPLIPEN